jgi:hypothetical protein
MGTDYTIHVGPFIECVVTRVPVQRARQTCPDQLCLNHQWTMPDGSCPACGKEVRQVPYEVIEDAVNPSQVVDAVGGRLARVSGMAYDRWSAESSCHLWLGNRHVPGRDPSVEPHAEFVMTPINARNVGEECISFEIFYRNDLAILRQYYGDAAVRVRWGIIQYAH